MKLVLLLLTLIPLLLPGQAIKDKWGRDLRDNGIILVDWEGHIANPAIQLFITPPQDWGASFIQIRITANHTRIYFSQLSSTTDSGPSRYIRFDTMDPLPMFVSIFPDRDGIDEDYTLTLNSTKGTVTYPIRVIDQDRPAAEGATLNIVANYSTDNEYNFLAADHKVIIQQAMDDWAFFLEDPGFDVVPANGEFTLISNSTSTGGYWVPNSAAYRGFLIYFRGTHNATHLPGGEPSSFAFQTINQQATRLRRSGEVYLDIHGNNSLEGWDLSITDDQWYKAVNQGRADLYSIVLHEIGHVIGFSDTYPVFHDFSVGETTSGQAFEYQKSPIYFDIYHHLIRPSFDRMSLMDGFGILRRGDNQMPRGRWLITKIDLLILQQLGQKLRKTSAFEPVSIVSSTLPAGTGGAYDATVEAKGGIPFYRFEILEGTLPAGLTLNTFTGKLSGTMAENAGAVLLVKVTDYDSESATKIINVGGVSRTAQVITFPELTDKQVGSSFQLNAESNSGLPITYTSSNVGVATISGNVLTVLRVGTAAISASQQGNTYYDAAETVTRTLVCTRGNQSIDFPPIAGKTLGGVFTGFFLNATATSKLEVEYSTTSDNIAIEGTSTVRYFRAGRATIKASQPGNDNYHAATPVEQSFCVFAAKPVITPSDLGTEAPVLTSSNTEGNRWFKNRVVLSGETGRSHTVRETGSYTVETTIQGCASEMSDAVTIVVTGVEPTPGTAVAIYPNPVIRTESHHELRVDLKSYDACPVDVSVLELSGRAVKKQHAVGGSVEVIDVSSLAQGVYLVRIQGNGGISMVRVGLQ
jgi:hypothetical protein